MTDAPAGLVAHPQRGRVLAEIHARPFAAVPVPCRIRHFAFLTDAAAVAADRAALDAFRRTHGLDPLDGEARHCRMQLGDFTLRWERHSEFTTYSWEYAGAPAAGALFATEVPCWPADHPPPGPLIAAADVHLTSAEDEEALARLFPGPEAAVSEVGGGAALIATDFSAGTDGFIRIAVLARALTPDGAGPLVQRILEIDTYRTLALLGLPEAQRVSEVVHRLEVALPPLIDSIRNSDGLVDNRGLLDRLSALSAELEAESAASSFRLGATRAYFELVQLRLEAIGEQQTAGGRRWAAFLSRRLNPAMRTCRSIEARQADLSRKLTRAAQLLRTQVEVDLAHQNRDLLKAMNLRVRLQTRLQQTVEGLSVFAITYYAAGLLHLVLEGTHHLLPAVDPALGTAIAVPPILLAVAWLIRRIRRHHAIVDIP